MSIKYLQLVEACRLNDTRMIIQLSIDQSPLQTYGSPLHLAISLSSRQCIIDLIILTNKSKLSNQWIIALNSDLETPLHLSAKLNRFDILDALFSIESINDTQRDATNHLAIHHSKQEKIIHYLNGNILLNSTSKIRIIEDKKHQFASLILQIVKEYIKEKDTKGLIIYFDTHERANAYLKIGWFDINLPIDSSTEEAILHYSAKWDDAELLNWALQNGADPNVKDKKGKKPFVV